MAADNIVTPEQWLAWQIETSDPDVLGLQGGEQLVAVLGGRRARDLCGSPASGRPGRPGRPGPLGQRCWCVAVRKRAFRLFAPPPRGVRIARPEGVLARRAASGERGARSRAGTGVRGACRAYERQVAGTVLRLGWRLMLCAA